MTDNTKQNPNGEDEIGDGIELGEEILEEMSGGAGPYYDVPKKRIRKPVKPDEPKEGGATGSW